MQPGRNELARNDCLAWLQWWLAAIGEGLLDLILPALFRFLCGLDSGFVGAPQVGDLVLPVPRDVRENTPSDIEARRFAGARKSDQRGLHGERLRPRARSLDPSRRPDQARRDGYQRHSDVTSRNASAVRSTH